MHQALFEIQWDYSQKHIDSMIEILKENAMHIVKIVIADAEKDTKQSTDLIVKVEGGDVAVRTRTKNIKFRDFTIRAKSYYGFKTELDKLREGFAQWYLYAWELDKGYEWVLIDMDRVRDSGLLDCDYPVKMNRDGTGFINIRLSHLQLHDCIVSKKLLSQTMNMIDRDLIALRKSCNVESLRT